MKYRKLLCQFLTLFMLFPMGFMLPAHQLNALDDLTCFDNEDPLLEGLPSLEDLLNVEITVASRTAEKISDPVACIVPVERLFSRIEELLPGLFPTTALTRLVKSDVDLLAERFYEDTSIVLLYSFLSGKIIVSGGPFGITGKEVASLEELLDLVEPEVSNSGNGAEVFVVSQTDGVVVDSTLNFLDVNGNLLDQEVLIEETYTSVIGHSKINFESFATFLIQEQVVQSIESDSEFTFEIIERDRKFATGSFEYTATIVPGFPDDEREITTLNTPSLFVGPADVFREGMQWAAPSVSQFSSREFFFPTPGIEETTTKTPFAAVEITSINAQLEINDEMRKTAESIEFTTNNLVVRNTGIESGIGLRRIDFDFVQNFQEVLDGEATNIFNLGLTSHLLVDSLKFPGTPQPLLTINTTGDPTTAVISAGATKNGTGNYFQDAILNPGDMLGIEFIVESALEDRGLTTDILVALHAPERNEWFLVGSEGDIRPLEDGPRIFDTIVLAESNQINLFGGEVEFPVTDALTGLSLFNFHLGFANDTSFFINLEPVSISLTGN